MFLWYSGGTSGRSKVRVGLRAAGRNSLICSRIHLQCVQPRFQNCLGLTECNHLQMSCVYQHCSKCSRAYVVISLDQSYVWASDLANLRFSRTLLFIPNHDTIACYNEPVYLWNYPSRCFWSISQLSQVFVPPSQLDGKKFLKLMRANMKYIVFVLFSIEYPSKRISKRSHYCVHVDIFGFGGVGVRHDSSQWKDSLS